MANLSVVIVAQDEERTIGAVLDGVRNIAGEVILVDSGSRDRTVEIAKEHGAKVYHQEWLGYAAQKNFALGLADGEWLLSLDADEIVSPELAQEISATINGGASDCDGFCIPRLLLIGDQPAAHGGFYPDAQLRLIRRGSGQFNDRLVHEAIKITGRRGMLKNALKHYAYADVAGFAEAMEKYARLSADEAKRKGGSWKANPLNELFHPCWTFFYRYFFRLGFLDGELGLKLNLIYSDYVRKKIRYMRAAARE